MAQIFPKWTNQIPTTGTLVLGFVATFATFATWYWASPKHTDVGYAPVQPIPYSHKLHADELGIDCRYCHANVERSQEAMLPATETCMGCHMVVKKDSPKLAALRDSWDSGNPVQWVRVHKLPDHVFFDHSVHVAVGVGCATCHGRIDQMEVVRLDKPIAMVWCLECHRDPVPNLRPKDQITNMSWKPSTDPVELAQADVHPPENCSGCHR